METNGPVKDVLKEQIRKEVLERMSRMSPKERADASLRVSDRLIAHQWFYLSDTILIFVGHGNEIDTGELIGEAFRTGKSVYVPKVTDAKAGQMDFYRITSAGELGRGYGGIPEPDGSTQMYVYDESSISHTLLIMPGVAFDPFRHRLGHGKGFYDRFLSERPGLALRSIAIGYECQMVDEIPCGQYDICPYQVITG